MCLKIKEKVMEEKENSLVLLIVVGNQCCSLQAPSSPRSALSVLMQPGE